MKKRAFVLADFIYGISLMIVAIVLALFIGKISTNFKNSIEENTILNELRSGGIIQFVYPTNHYVLNTKNFDLKIFSLKDIKIIYKIFFISNSGVSYCGQDIYKLNKGLNIIPLNLVNCINSSEGKIRISIIYNDKLALTKDLLYNEKVANIEILNMPLRNYVIIGADVFEGLPNLYYSTTANKVYLELGSPYYALEKLIDLNKGEKKVINVSSFNYDNLTFSLDSYYEGIFSIYINGYYVGSLSSGENLNTKYKNDYFVKSFDIYEGTNPLLHLENTQLTVDNYSYKITIKNFEICLEDAHNSSIKIPGYVFVRNTKKLYYTDHGTYNSCVYVPLAFTPDLQQHVINAYSLDNKKFGNKVITSSTSSPIIIKLSE